MHKIDIILPYKELFSKFGASAVSISVKNSLKYSQFLKSINIYGQFVEEPFNIGNFHGFHSKKLIHFGNNLSILKQYIKATKYDQFKKIIEVHNRPYLFNYIVNKKELKHPVLLYFHNDPLSMKGSRSIKQRSNIIKKASAIIFVSNFLKKKFLQGIEGNYNNIFVIPNSLDKNLKSKNYVKSKQVIFVGRIVKEKGVDLYVNVLKKISQKYKDWKFLLIGTSRLGYYQKTDFEKKIEHIVNSLGKNVIFSGYRTNENVNTIMSKSSILVVPSIWEEPFGITALEGMSNRMALICSEVGGLKEIVKDRGILIKNIDEVKLQKNLENLINNPNILSNYQRLAWKNYSFDQKNISMMQDNIRKKIFED